MSYGEYGHKGLYRSRNRIIAGVCGGIAEYFDFSAFWIRVIAVGLLVCTGLWPVAFLYLLAAMMMKKDPYVTWRG